MDDVIKGTVILMFRVVAGPNGESDRSRMYCTGCKKKWDVPVEDVDFEAELHLLEQHAERVIRWGEL